MTRYGDPGHEQWLIEQEQEDERWGGHLARQEIMAEIGRRETEGLDWVDEPADATLSCFHCGKVIPPGRERVPGGSIHCGHRYCHEAYDWMQQSRFEVAKAERGEVVARYLTRLWGAAGVRSAAAADIGRGARREAYLAYGGQGEEAFDAMENGGVPESDYDEGGPS